FELIEHLLRETGYRASPEELNTCFPVEKPPFVGGILGYVAYDSYRHLETLPLLENLYQEATNSDEHLAEAVLVEPTSILALNEESAVLSLIEWHSGERHSNEHLQQRLNTAVSKLRPSGIPLPAINAAKLEETPEEFVGKSFSAKYDRTEYEELVTRAKAYICAGDIFQLVLSNRFRREQKSDALEIYSNLLLANPSPYHFYLNTAEFELVGASPEKYLSARRSKHKTKLSTRLVAGSYPLSVPEREHEKVGAKLSADPKEQAEHIMLVDHMRNDLGRVARTGSVKVEELLTGEPYQDVMHLVSQVDCELEEETPLCRANESLFPMATLAGTPKIRAVEIIAELEQECRGPFGGTFFCISHDQEFMESSVIIRSAIIHPESIEIRAGGGIVYDSNPTREYQECFWKAAAIARACLKASEA
ncbi:UNVERIFIED_CONTAM: hypothetical protein GTU68_024064, partial [Idotea baltica]|nr:hypothetical protein [Idotea baltica]